MAEEIVTKFRCDRCDHVEEVVMTSGFFGIVLKKPAPPGWGSDRKGGLMLCAHCYTEYQQQYTAWFNAWMHACSKAIERT
ncbi:MAG: hypothetical protein JW840_02925 [Candidatus Thermoplasmatota archaeon]|nr:hypothetical protein [Candidatus Thermoplasmatota archaeon]